MSHRCRNLHTPQMECANLCKCIKRINIDTLNARSSSEFCQVGISWPRVQRSKVFWSSELAVEQQRHEIIEAGLPGLPGLPAPHDDLHELNMNVLGHWADWPDYQVQRFIKSAYKHV